MALHTTGGRRRVSVVTGSAVVGVHSSDGGLNVVTGSSGRGIYHPSGAFRATIGTGNETSIYAPDGSLYIVLKGADYVLR